MDALRWTPPSREDDPAWVDLLAAMESVDHRGEAHELEDLADEWASVWSHPDTDAVFVWDGAVLVAFGWLNTIPGERKQHRIELWGGVRPSHRGRGIGRELLDWQMRRASAVAKTLDSRVPTLLEVGVTDHQAAMRRLAERSGFTPTRRFLEVARPTALALAPAEVPEGFDVLPWSSHIDELVRDAHAASFVDHWGSEPRTQEEWRQWYTGHRGFRPDLSLVALEQGTGGVAGFVLSAAYPNDWGILPVEAWINTVGTRREWRGKGLARGLLTEVLRRVADADTGFERAILGVDAENPTGALGLYRSLGFEDVRAVTSMCRGPL
jgi:mycothiol synthase